MGISRSNSNLMYGKFRYLATYYSDVMNIDIFGLTCCPPPVKTDLN
jgi:hypothetical protein